MSNMRRLIPLIIILLFFFPSLPLSSSPIRFNDGSYEQWLYFYSPGYNNTAELTIPKGALVTYAELNISGHPLGERGYINDTNGEFTGDAINLDILPEGIKLKGMRNEMKIDTFSGAGNGISTDYAPGNITLAPLSYSLSSIGLSSSSTFLDNFDIPTPELDWNFSTGMTYSPVTGNMSIETAFDFFSTGTATNNTSIVKSRKWFEEGSVLEVRTRIMDNNISHWLGFANNFNSRMLTFEPANDQNLYYRSSNDSSSNLTWINAYDINSYHLWRIVWFSGNITYYYDSIKRLPIHNITTSYPQSVFFASNSMGIIRVDWVKVYGHQSVTPVFINILNPFGHYVMETVNVSIYNYNGSELYGANNTTDGKGYVYVNIESFPSNFMLGLLDSQSRDIGNASMNISGIEGLYPGNVYNITLSSTFTSTGIFTSLPIDISTDVRLNSLSKNAIIPPGTSINIELRLSSDGLNWSEWCSDISNCSTGRFLQYKISLSTSNSSITPSLDTIYLNYTTYMSGGEYVSPLYSLAPLTEVDVEWNAELNGQIVSVYINAGDKWYPAENGATVYIPEPVDKVRYKLILNTTSSANTPLLRWISLTFGGGIYPINPSLDVGDDGTIDWRYTGIFNKYENVNITTALNSLIKDYPKGKITGTLIVTLNVTSSSMGIIELSSLTIETNYPPMIESVSPNVNNLTISKTHIFEINASDADGGEPKIYWYLDGNLVGEESIYALVPSETLVGEHVLIAEVDDGQANVSYRWDLNILPINRNPVIAISSPLSNGTYYEGENIIFDASQTYDPDNDSLSFQWFININETSQSSRFETTLSTNTYTITLTVEDGKGGRNTSVFTINVFKHRGIPDIKYIMIEPENPRAGDTLIIRLIVNNTGEGLWEGYVLLFIDNATIASVVSELLEIPAGEERETAITWIASAGTHRLKISVGNVSEEREIYVEKSITKKEREIPYWLLLFPMGILVGGIAYMVHTYMKFKKMMRGRRRK